MDRQELKREIIRMYANCGSYILQLDSYNKGNCITTRFRHPTRKKIIEVTEDIAEIRCVLVYNQTNNAHQRHAVECKTIEQFRKAIA